MSTYLEKLDYLEETKDLIKNAIESKGVSVSDTDTFRDYADKIGEISGGGDSPEEDDDDGIYYRFFDYDGKLLYKYTEEEKNALTELPPCNEVHEGLNFCGWSWTLDELKSVNLGANVGAFYETTDGLTHLLITVKEPIEMQLYGGNGNYLASVNWGDGSPEETMEAATRYYHWYEVGDYDITFTHKKSGGNYFQFYNLSWDKAKAYPYWNIDFKELRLGSGVSFYTGDQNFNCNLSKISIDGKMVSTIDTTGFRKLEVEFFSSKADISDKTSGTVYIKGKYPSYKYKKDYTKIANNFFQGSNIKNFIVPDGVLSIGNDVFKETNIESITLPNTLTSIGNNAFAYSPLQEITLPDSVSSLGQACFEYCRNLKKVIIPKNTTVLNSDLFEYCSSLQEITLPEGITKISQYCFSNCSTLQSITIPASVSDMNGGSIFNSCNSLVEVHMKPTTPPTLNSNAFGYGTTLPAGNTARIYVPYSEDHSILAAYKAATNWSKYATYIVEEPEE